MIKLYLKAKHWQLFIVMLGIPIFFQLYALFSMFTAIESQTNSNPQNVIGIFEVFPIIMILFTGVFFGWFWSIAIGLQKKIPNELKLNVKKFKVFFFIPLIYIISLVICIGGSFYGLGTNWESNNEWILIIILPLHLFSMFCIFYTMYFVARTIKTVELQRNVGVGEYILEFFLLWFYIVGIWIIQPKVNKLAKLNHSS